MANACVVVLDPELAPRDQTAWPFTNDDDAKAVALFLGTCLGDGREIAWATSFPSRAS